MASKDEIMTAMERVETPISIQELERRWAAVRKEMAARGIDALVMQNASDWLGGYVKWFTDVPAHNDYPRNIIFHRSDLMTVVEMGNKDRRDRLDGKDPLNPGVGDMIASPSFFSVAYTHDYDAVLIAQELKRRGYKTIGWVGRGRLQYDLVRVVEAQVPGATFVDATEFIDQLKAIKSEEEIALIRRAAAMQDAQWAKVVATIKPDMRDSEITALAQYEGELLGSEQGLFRCSSAPFGEPAILRGRHYQGRVMQRGDYMTLLIENNGPGGFYAELARTVVFGKASQELRDGFAVVCDAQKHTVAKLKPGASCAEIYASHNDYMKSRGAPPELRLYGHSQGYDLVERPLLRSDETMPLAANMCMAVHPGFFKPTNFVFICDNFLIHKDGSAEHLHKSEQKIWEV
jgi:Xaa-Pro aminopeptidase